MKLGAPKVRTASITIAYPVLDMMFSALFAAALHHLHPKTFCSLLLIGFEDDSNILQIIHIPLNGGDTGAQQYRSLPGYGLWGTKQQTAMSHPSCRCLHTRMTTIIDDDDCDDGIDDKIMPIGP